MKNIYNKLSHTTKSLVILTYLLFSSVITAQNRYYVSSSNGKDSNNGTSESSPWETITKVNSEMSSFTSGDIISFKKDDIFTNSSLIVTASGTIGDTIYFSSYGNGSLPILGSPSMNELDMIRINGDYIKVENFEIRAGNSAGGISNGIVIYGKNVRIENNHIIGYIGTTAHNGTGIIIGEGGGFGTNRYIDINNNEVEGFSKGIINGGGYYVVISNNEVHNIWDNANAVTDGGWGIRIIGSTSNFLDFKYTSRIANNEVYDFERYGIDCATASSIIIEGNHIHSSLDATYGGTNGLAAGIKAAEDKDVKNENKPKLKSLGNIIRYNIIHNLRSLTIGSIDPANDGITTTLGPDGWIYGNLIYDIDGYGIIRRRNPAIDYSTQYSWKIYNNTIISGKECIYVDGVNSATYISNNIFEAPTGYSALQLLKNSYEGNNIYTNRSGIQTGTTIPNPPVAVWQKYNKHTNYGSENKYNADPLFTDKTHKNFKLNSTKSPAYNTGHNWNDIFKIPDGSTYSFDIDANKIIANFDIGAFEHNFESSVTQPNGFRVFLEGAYNQGEMHTVLSSSETLPKTQPYNISPWNFEGNSVITSYKDNYVDWILIELRSNESNTEYRKTAILTEAGKIINTDGSDFLFTNINSGNFYIVIKHRNHLSIMSSEIVSIINAEKINYDFTHSLNSAFGNNSLISLGDGNFGMISGDGDANNVINNLDYGSVANKILYKGYDQGDLDMNGIVNVLDYSNINKNYFKTTSVPD